MANSEYCSRDPAHLLKVFTGVAELASKYITQHYTHEKKVINFVPPEELKRVFDFSLPKEGVKITDGLESIRKTLEDVLEYSVRTGNPRYMNQLWSGTDVASIVAEWVSAFTNSSTYTYEVAPVYSLMEIELVNELLRMVGFPGGDGILAPGGAISNLMGMLCARQKKFPESRKSGNPPDLVAFTSAHSHYTLKRSAWMMGLGHDGCRNVPVNAAGKMTPEALRREVAKAREEGLTPFFVNVTCGSTVLGVYDDIEGIADVCRDEGLWMHIDAAWGGSVLFSEKWKHLMKGCDRADSIAWCLHKLMGINQQCSVILLKEANLLKKTNASNADYLFHSDDTKPYDLGDKTLNCGRRQDSFKFWLSWKVHGTDGFGKRVDTCFSNCAFFVEELKRRSDRFELLFEPENLQVCFFYLPECMRGAGDSPDRGHKLGEYVRVLRRRIQEAGNMLVNYNPLSASPPDFAFVPNHWRIVFANPEQTHADLLYVLDEMDRLGRGMVEADFLP